jgi:Tfp pilus assembly protein PilZ
MKRYTSRFLKSVALFYMAFPIAYMILAALVFDIPAASYIHILLSPLYYLISFIAVISGWGLWEMSRWAWYVFGFANFMIVYENALVMKDYSESHHKLFGFIFSLLMVGFVFLRVSREIRVPYFFPKIRWWESDPRYRLAVRADLVRKVSEDLVAGEILDLSGTGCFIKTRIELKTDEPVALKFEAFKLPVQCDGIVVWKSESTVTHPKGVGIKFTTVDRQSKRNLRMISKRLKSIAQFYRTSRYLLTQDEFLKKLEEIEGRAWTKPSKKAQKDALKDAQKDEKAKAEALVK